MSGSSGIVGATIILTMLAASAQSAAAWESAHQGHNSQSASRNAYAAPSRQLHQSGNSCAPDRAEPVWGEGNAFLGYSCETASANGS